MFKKILISVIAVSTLFACSLSVSAAPQKMADGGIFDAKYYAIHNQDVVNALGTNDALALYDHYKYFGAEEGRKPYTDTCAQDPISGISAVNGIQVYFANKGGGAAKNWYDGYEVYTWYDMGGYFFYLTPTQKEANQAACDCTQSRFFGEYLWQSELWSRYPNAAVSYFSTGADGYGIAMVCSNYEDENGRLHRPKYIWEKKNIANVIYDY